MGSFERHQNQDHNKGKQNRYGEERLRENSTGKEHMCTIFRPTTSTIGVKKIVKIGGW